IGPVTYDPADLAALLPLPPATFHILLALANGDRHGYGIIQDVAARTNGALRLSPGTLYRTIQRLLEQGLIVEPKRRSDPLDDPGGAITASPRSAWPRHGPKRAASLSSSGWQRSPGCWRRKPHDRAVSAPAPLVSGFVSRRVRR